MNYIFLGTPEFASIILEKLIKAGYPPALLVCNSDKPVGRKKIVTPPPVKVAAQKYGINFWQPEKLELNDLEIKIEKIEFAVVAAYSKILPKEIIGFPKLGTIGVHPSLLPKYRGASPIQSVLLNGEKKTGTSLYLMDERIDHGPILAKKELNQELEKINYEKLLRELANLSADLLIETLPKFITGKIKSVIQNETEATYTKKFKTDDGYINPEDLKLALNGNSEKTIVINRKIRALNPEPGTWTIWQKGDPFNTAQNKRIKLLEAEIVEEKLRLKIIQVEGKKPQVIS